MDNDVSISAWFAGPKAENGEAFAAIIQRVVQDYHAWRRNYFPEDGVVLDSAQRRANEPFFDAFEDRLTELLGRLKADYPFQSPRYAGHMISEQTLPSIAGWFATMLYNPNNVTAEVAPVTVQLELEAARMIARMVGYGEDSWAHLTSGGTIANIEALWLARTVAVLPHITASMREELGLPTNSLLSGFGLAPDEALQAFSRCFAEAETLHGVGEETTRRIIRAYVTAEANVAEHGVADVARATGWNPVVFAPETHHYCLLKAMDVLGLGRQSLRRVPVDGEFRMDLSALETMLDEAIGNGEHPMAVVAVAGTTEEGAIDPIDRIARLRQEREKRGLPSFWLHADAAYGGYLRTMAVPQRMGLGEPETQVKLGGEIRTVRLDLGDRGACAALESLSETDSVAIDPHKLGYVPYPAGAVCFRSDLVRPLARQEAPYLEDEVSGIDAERKSEGIGVYILEGSKPGAAAAAVWLSHSLISLDISGHGRLMQSTVRNAAELYELLERVPDWTGDRRVQAICLCPPGSNIVCYAFRPSGDSPGLRAINALNRDLYRQFTVGAEGSSRFYGQRFFVSRTTLHASQYSPSTVNGFLERLGVDPLEYEKEGVFLLRSVLMNPWYEESKRRGRFFLSEMVVELYDTAERLVGI